MPGVAEGRPGSAAGGPGRPGSPPASSQARLADPHDLGINVLRCNEMPSRLSRLMLTGINTPRTRRRKPRCEGQLSPDARGVRTCQTPRGQSRRAAPARGAGPGGHGARELREQAASRRASEARTRGSSEAEVGSRPAGRWAQARSARLRTAVATPRKGLRRPEGAQGSARSLVTANPEPGARSPEPGARAAGPPRPRQQRGTNALLRTPHRHLAGGIRPPGCFWGEAGTRGRRPALRRARSPVSTPGLGF